MLPSREHYDIEGAAEFLGCSVNDVEYYIKEGHLRYAMFANSLGDVAVFRNDDLPSQLRHRVETVDHPDFMDCLEIQISAAEAPEDLEEIRFLYITHADLTTFYVTEDKGQDIRPHIFETLEGTRCTLWTRAYPVSLHTLWGERMGQLNDKGMLSETLLSREELETLRSSADPSEDRKTYTASSDQTPAPTVFEPPEKADEIAIDLCEFANRYVAEFKKEPTGSALAGYMSNTGKDEIGFEKVGREEYRLNGKKLTLRSLKERLKTYRTSR